MSATDYLYKRLSDANRRLEEARRVSGRESANTKAAEAAVKAIEDMLNNQP